MAKFLGFLGRQRYRHLSGCVPSKGSKSPSHGRGDIMDLVPLIYASHGLSPWMPCAFAIKDPAKRPIGQQRTV